MATCGKRKAMRMLLPTVLLATRITGAAWRVCQCSPHLARRMILPQAPALQGWDPTSPPTIPPHPLFGKTFNCEGACCGWIKNGLRLSEVPSAPAALQRGPSRMKLVRSRTGIDPYMRVSSRLSRATKVRKTPVDASVGPGAMSGAVVGKMTLSCVRFGISQDSYPVNGRKTP